MLFNEYKNVKTVVFSELPKHEKMKYFNFLLENEINFSKDESGNYVALVKVLNPQYYAEKEKHRNNSNLSAHFEDNEGKEEKLLNKGRSSSQQMKSSKKNGKRYNKNSDFEKPEVKRILPNYFETFSRNYPKFFEHLNPLHGVRGKRVHISQLKYVIEEIYSIRFIKDTSSLKNQLNKKSEIEGSEPFPVFVVDFFINKFVKKPIVDQHALDLLMSIDYYKEINREVAIFTRFLTQEYDTDDLIFFLFVRSCIEKEMKIMFIEKARDEMKMHASEDKDNYSNDLFLNIKVCLKIANTIFGNEEELLLNSFREKVEKNMEMMDHGRYVIKASTILDITLQDYHQSRHQFGNEFGRESEYQNNNNNLNNNVSSVNNLNLNAADMLEKKQMNFRGSKVFDDHNDEEYIQNKSGYGEQKVSLSKFVDRDYSANDDSYNRKYSNNKLEDDSFIDTNARNNMNAQQKNFSNNNNQNSYFADKIALIKVLISNYLKEKELDIFFEKLMTSYTSYEKNNEQIQKIMANIKDLVSKKLNILINILFNKDKYGWISSLKIHEEDVESMRHYEELIYMINKMIEMENVKEIPSDKIEEFAQSLLITPELINQINKLILKHFG